MLKLEVQIDQNSGFCFGVVYAIEMAEEILKQDGHLYCLGDIVHNDEEISRLERLGLQIIDFDQLKGIHNSKVLIRAHGEPPSTYKLAVENNLTLIDASCPVVLKLQNRIKNAYDRGDQVYIYGKHGHAEVIGLLGQTHGQAVVFQDLDELDIQTLPSEMTVFSQTTKSTDSFYEVIDALNRTGVKVSANDTICRQVSNRDKELRLFAHRFDIVIFVSGRKSSNGKMLYQICKDSNPNTHFVSDASELKKDWFGQEQTVGICGATSTPMWLMRQVKEHLLTY